MFRILVAITAALAASACTVGLPSAVEAAPFAARMATAPFADGAYCPLEKNEAGELLVTSRDEDGDTNCGAFSWDASRRVFVIEDLANKTQTMEFAPADLGDGLFLMQLPETGKDKDDKPYGFTLMAGIAHGAAVLVLPFPSDAQAKNLAAQHPGVTLSLCTSCTSIAETPVAEADADTPEPVTASRPDVFYISAGSPADIRRFARDIAIWMISELVRSAEQGGTHDDGMPMIIRDQSGRESHLPSAAQQHDIDMLTKKMRALAS